MNQAVITVIITAIAGLTHISTARANTACAPEGEAYGNYAPCAFGHLVGHPTPDGAWATAPTDAGPSFLSYGPYTTAIPAGSHRATFTLSASTTSSSAYAGYVDVVSGTGTVTHARKWFRPYEFTAPGQPQSFSVDFTTTGGEDLEFRVWWTGVTNLTLHRVDIEAATSGGDPTCEVPSGHASYPACAFSHVVGHQRNDGTWETAAADPGANFLSYGPYTSLGAGNHRATFHLAVADNSSSKDVGYIDVVSGYGAVVHARRFVYGTEFYRPGDFQPFAIDFTTTGAESTVEFRVWWSKRTDLALLEVDVDSTDGVVYGGALGAIGDSISAGMDADDGCGTLISCAANLGEDRRYSWTTGDLLPDSVRNRLGFSTTVERQKNGSRWRDAAGQAQAIIDAGGAGTITIELGGNDVCAALDSTLPWDRIEGDIDAAFSTIVAAPVDRRAATVIVGEAPDIVSLYDTMKEHDNFVFETCQDLWDLDTSHIEVNTCDWGFFDFVCDIADFVVESVVTFADPLIDYLITELDVDFPCGYVLNSASTPEKREEARLFNQYLNDTIAAKVAEYNAMSGQTGVVFKLAANVYEHRFTTAEVSQLDCFHPNRLGQKNLAKLVVYGAGVGGFNTLTTDTNPPYLVDGTAAAWWHSGSAVTYQFDTSELASLEIWSYDCTAASWSFEGITEELPTHHEIKIEGLDYAHYWAIFVRPVDGAMNPGDWYSSGCI